MVSTISKEEELLILEDGLKSPFWAVYSAHLSHMSFTLIGAALSQKVEQREWTAGKANGMKEALNYPAKRVQDIKKLLESQKSKQEGK